MEEIDNCRAAFVWGVTAMFLIPVLGGFLENKFDKNTNHLQRLKTDVIYAKKYYDKKYPLGITDNSRGIELTLCSEGGVPIYGLDSNKDGIIDEAFHWAGGGRAGFSQKIFYNKDELRYSSIQKRYRRETGRSSLQ